MFDKKFMITMGLALALPSTILGAFFLVYFLHQNEILSLHWGLLVLILVIANSFYLMVRYARFRKDKD